MNNCAKYQHQAQIFFVWKNHKMAFSTFLGGLKMGPFNNFFYNLNLFLCFRT